MENLSAFTSNKIKFLSFLCMVMVVFDHCYNLTDRYLQPFTTPTDKLTITSFTEYFVANGITRFLIPLLFCISGYLTAMRTSGPGKK